MVLSKANTSNSASFLASPWSSSFVLSSIVAIDTIVLVAITVIGLDKIVGNTNNRKTKPRPPNESLSTLVASSMVTNLFSTVGNLLERTWRRMKIDNNGYNMIPIWIGSFWLLWRHQRQSQQQQQIMTNPSPTLSNSLSLVADAFIVSLLLTSRSSTSTSSHQDTTKENQSGSSSSSEEMTSHESQNHLPTRSVHEDIQTRDIAVSSGGGTSSEEVISKESSSNQGRFVEMLVHNVSHTDLILSLDAPPLLDNYNNGETNEDDLYCL